jgi:hypothetical protein
MSREKEIIEAGIEYTMRTKPNMLAGDKFSEEMREFNRNKAFEEGAKWADKTMIDKACEWLKCVDFEVDYITTDSDGYTFFNADKFIEEFCKTME